MVGFTAQIISTWYGWVSEKGPPCLQAQKKRENTLLCKRTDLSATYHNAHKTWWINLKTWLLLNIYTFSACYAHFLHRDYSVSKYRAQHGCRKDPTVLGTGSRIQRGENLRGFHVDRNVVISHKSCVRHSYTFTFNKWMSIKHIKSEILNWWFATQKQAADSRAKK